MSSLLQSLSAIALAGACGAMPLAAYGNTAKPNSQAKESGKVSRYKEIKEELPADLYPSYRMLERLMQANEIEESVAIAVRPAMAHDCPAENKALCQLISDLPSLSKEDSVIGWALQSWMTSNGSPQATATSMNNTIRMYKTLLDPLAGKPEAKACVVAHELAHIVKNHTKSANERRMELDASTASRVASAVKNAHSAKRSGQFWGAMAMGLNAAASGLNSANGDYGSALRADLANMNMMQNMQMDQALGSIELNKIMSMMNQGSPQVYKAMTQMDGLGQKLVRRTMRDVVQYTKAATLQLREFEREQEIEADSLAIEYMVNANLNPKACLEAMDLVHRNSASSETDEMSTHPGEEERLENINEIIDNLTPRQIDKVLLKTKPKYEILPYIYNESTEIVRIMPKGTEGMNPGSNKTSNEVESLFGE